jgi:PPK2 family polyphosphate:nucleotide phosphotransferase
MAQPFKIKGKIRLKDFDPDFHDGKGEREAVVLTSKLCERIGELQRLLYANANRSLLLILQGMDASGKDGVSRSVLDRVNPSGVETSNFKTPSHEELAHDFLWRVHKATPRFGSIGVFNRSHYEEVLVVRVLGLKPKPVWKRRYTQINDFERLLAKNGVVILKFFLHISKKEQAKRLEDRLKDPAKNWKFSPDDLKMRLLWREFQEAYEDVINKCYGKHARWHVVPANHKWYRNYVVAKATVGALESLKMTWPKSPLDLSKVRIP